MDTRQKTVRQYMTLAPSVVAAGLRLGDAADLMVANNVRYLIVVDGDDVVGTVSLADVELASALDPRGDRAPLLVALRIDHLECEADAPLCRAVEALEVSRGDCVVVRDRGAVVGILTASDAHRALREVLTGLVAPRSHYPSHLEPRSTRPVHTRHYNRVAEPTMPPLDPVRRAPRIR